ncbi:MAG TPA: diguanylate cyclase, partial [Rhodocyclaceae bacterium]|nr:diguanylate cyclase [Rhodocyclaceae bacterium]
MTTSASDETTQTERDPLRERTVLYVEDDRIVQKITQKLLEKRFARVWTADNGVAGLALFRKHRPDMVITDIRMPEMDGLELSSIIKSESPATPIIVTTLFNLQDYFLRAIDIGIDHYLLKPIDANHIYRVLERISRNLQALAERRMYEQAFLNAGSAIAIHDLKQHIIAVNDAFCRLSGYSRSELIGKTPILWRSGHHPESFYEEIQQHLEKHGSWQGEVKNRHRNGEIFVGQLSLSTVRDDADRGLSYVAVTSDITERAQHEATLSRLAHHDPLTDLPNRLLLADRIQQGIGLSHRNTRRMALLYVDLDRFKPVNDRYGHLVGDRLLRQVADRLSEVVRSVDTVARIGGDEFVMLLPNVINSEDAAQVANKIIHT